MCILFQLAVDAVDQERTLGARPHGTSTCMYVHCGSQETFVKTTSTASPDSKGPLLLLTVCACQKTPYRDLPMAYVITCPSTVTRWCLPLLCMYKLMCLVRR